MFKIIKNSAMSEGPVNELFNLDSLQMRSMVNRVQLKEVLNSYSYKSKTRATAIHEYVTNCMFANMGGTKDTPLDEIAAFFYVLYKTDSFKFNEWCELIYSAINIDNIFFYFDDTNTTVPSGYVKMLSDKLQDQITMEIITDRHSFTVEHDDSPKAVAKFVEFLGTKIQDYLENADSMKNVLNSLNISTDELPQV